MFPSTCLRIWRHGVARHGDPGRDDGLSGLRVAPNRETYAYVCRSTVETAEDLCIMGNVVVNKGLRQERLTSSQLHRHNPAYHGASYLLFMMTDRAARDCQGKCVRPSPK